MKMFHSIRVAEVIKETGDCTRLTFDIPKELEETFSFKQGQHLTLRKIINGQDIRRSYSLCSSPLEKKWQVAVKKIPGGLFSDYVNSRLKAGEVLELMPPNGTFFTEINREKPKNYVAFAAGSGITPVISIIKTHLALEPGSTFKLFYLNKNVKSIIFKDEIEGLKNTYFNRFEIFHFLTREARNIPLLNGRFTPGKLKTIFSKLVDVKEIDECFICGPEEMILLIKDELTAAGLEEDKIHFELFVSGKEVSQKQIDEVLKQQADHTKVTIIDGGKQFHFDMEPGYDNILDAALANDADLPFACKGGVCSTCKSKLIKGKVKMKANYALEKDEVEKGYILTCQSVPISEELVIDFDH